MRRGWLDRGLKSDGIVGFRDFAFVLPEPSLGSWTFGPSRVARLDTFLFAKIVGSRTLVHQNRGVRRPLSSQQAGGPGTQNDHVARKLLNPGLVVTTGLPNPGHVSASLPKSAELGLVVTRTVGFGICQFAGAVGPGTFIGAGAIICCPKVVEPGSCVSKP